MDYRKTIRLYYDYVIPCYTKTPLVIERGRGTRVWDAHGDEYLDFFPGWAVSGIGHCHRRVTADLFDRGYYRYRVQRHCPDRPAFSF